MIILCILYATLFHRFWPDYVKQRVHHTYMYFAGSTVIAVASAAAVMRSPRAMALVARGTIPVTIYFLLLRIKLFNPLNF